MAIEIERKFLVSVTRLPALTDGVTVVQGYVPTDNGTTVRVRLIDDRAYLCLKTAAGGFSRHEYEYAIPVPDARALLEQVCHSDRIEKQRYFLKMGDLTWEIDVFRGANAGLIIAEVELASEHQEVSLPDWIDTEVTMDRRFSNYSLSRQPFSTWPPAAGS